MSLGLPIYKNEGLFGFLKNGVVLLNLGLDSTLRESKYGWRKEARGSQGREHGPALGVTTVRNYGHWGAVRKPEAFRNLSGFKLLMGRK